MATFYTQHRGPRHLHAPETAVCRVTPHVHVCAGRVSGLCGGSQLDLLGVSTGVVPRARLAHVLPQLLGQLVVPWLGVGLGVRVRVRVTVRVRLRLRVTSRAGSPDGVGKPG